MRGGSWLSSLVFAASMAGLGGACTSSDDRTASQSEAEPISAAALDLLPENTRGVLWADLDGLLSSDASAAVRDALLGQGKEPALSTPLALVQRHLVGIDPAQVDSALLLQTTDARQGFALIAQLTQSDALDVAALSQKGSHRGHPLYEDADTGLTLAQLDDHVIVVAQASLLGLMLDVDAGAEKSAMEHGALGPYLSALSNSGSLRFVLGLPGLFNAADKRPDDLTLLGARAISGALELSSTRVSGPVSIFTDNAEAFVTTYAEITGDAAVSVAPSTTSALPPSVVLTLDETPLATSAAEHLASRSSLKRLFYGMNAIDYAGDVGAGGNAPWMNFEVAESPNSIFINFRFKDEQQIQAFEAEHLPQGFKLSKVRIFEDEEPGYFLVLNVYDSGGGLVSGARAEWSVFAQDPVDGKPRFLVVQAAAETISADSVNLLTEPEPVTHELTGNTISTYVGVKEGETERAYFTSQISWPPSSSTAVRTAAEFVAANDYIFWGNAVADRGLYNGTVHNRDVLRVGAGDLVVDDKSRWAGYVEAEPAHAFVYQNGLEIVVSPWWNLDADYLDVTDDHRTQLTDFKNGFYPGTIKSAAEKAMRGEGEVLSSLRVDNAVPGAFYQFEVLDPAAFERALSLPEGHRLSPVRVFADDAEAVHLVTLHVYSVAGDPSGVRADFYAYTDDGGGRAHRMIIDASSADVRIDPITLIGLPDVVTHTFSDSSLSTAVQSRRGSFAAALDLSQSADAAVSLDWVETYDYTCWLDGICTKSFYDGATLNEPVQRLAPGGVAIETLDTPWDGLIATQPQSVFVRRVSQTFAQNPWHNIP
jgi:hypothetical protein